MSMIGRCCIDFDPKADARFARPRLMLRRLWTRLLAGLVAADARHRARVHLGQLDARMLRDIGVSAGDIARERAAILQPLRPGETARRRGSSARAGL